MSKTAGVSLETKNAVVWLERQPGVRSVVLSRFTRVKHHQKAGFTRVGLAKDDKVTLRTYDTKGVRDLFVYAEKSPLRDAWVASLASGEVIGVNGYGPKVASPRDLIKPVPTASLAPDRVQKPGSQLVEENAAQLYDVTPELAARWLEHNTRNRPLRNDTVLKYAADMKVGKWLVTGDSIGFDTNGAIVNGQHRLWAVLESGVTVRMQVTFNLQPEVVRVLDDHLRRNLADIAKIARPGFSVTVKHTAVARIMLMGLRRSRLGATDVKNISRQEQLEFMERHWDAIVFAQNGAFKSTGGRAITSSPVVAVVARASYTKDHDRLKQFAQVILSGMPDGQGDKAAVTLRNWLLRQQSYGVRALSDLIYRKTERALEAFLNHEALSTLYEAPKELFLLPEEQADKKRGKA